MPRNGCVKMINERCCRDSNGTCLRMENTGKNCPGWRAGWPSGALLRSGGGTKRMEVGKRFAGKTFHCVIGEQQAVTIDENGWGEFAVRGGGCSVYVPRVGLFLRIRHLFKDVKRFFRVS